jgi:hypothetical protein
VAVSAGVLGRTAAEAAAVEVEVTAVYGELVAACASPSIQPISGRPTTPASRRMRRLALVDSLAIMCVIFIAGRGGRSMEEAMRQTLGLPSGVVRLPALSLKNL